VLIVEDDLQTCRALQRLLEVEGYDVRSAHTLAEATAALAISPPDFVLLDLMLPDGDGRRLIDPIRQRDTSINIAVMTGSPDLLPAKRKRLRGADIVLVKPIRAEPLLRWMRLEAVRAGIPAGRC
jgi:DNA-binding response OmpR family regulator